MICPRRWAPMLVFLLATAGMSGCAKLHDDKGWEHEGDPGSHEDATPYIFEHRH